MPRSTALAPRIGQTQQTFFVKSIDTFGRVSYIDGRVRSEPEKAPRRNTASRRCFFCGKAFFLVFHALQLASKISANPPLDFLLRHKIQMAHLRGLLNKDSDTAKKVTDWTRSQKIRKLRFFRGSKLDCMELKTTQL